MNKECPEELIKTSEKIKNEEISPVEILKYFFRRIEKIDSELNSFITINYKEAMIEAVKAEKEIRKGDYKGPLHGIPIGLKDNINTKKYKTTNGAELCKDFLPKENAFVVDTLQEQGAIIIGKLNLHQFSFGPTGDCSYYGPVRNPYDKNKMTGGSSSGSAAAVSSLLCYGAIGTDSSGSIRVPSSFCGVVGMKPTFGTISTRGVHPLSWTLDHIGPISKNIMDNALLLNAIAKYDSKYFYSNNRNPEDFTRHIGKNIKNRVIGIPRSYYYDNLNAEIADSIQKTIKHFESLGARIIYVNIPNMYEIWESQKKIINSDAYSALESYLKSFPDRMDNEIKERLFDSLYIKGYEYSRAMQVQQLSKKIFYNVFEKIDILLTPTVPILPLNINERRIDKGDSTQYIQSIINKFSSPTNLNGLPSLSLPCGFSSDNLPIGVQLIANELEEAKLYQFGYALEQKLNKP